MPVSSRYILFITIVAAIGGLLFGFDTAIIAGAIGFLKDRFALTALQEGLAVGSLLVGCIAGASIAGSVSDWLGRKRFLLIAASLFIVSGIGAALAHNIGEFVFARFLGGIGVGSASMLSPLYIAEVSPAAIRGRLVSLNQLTIVSGMLLAYFVNWALAGIGPANWRWMLGSETLPALIFFLLLLRVPESPRWLVKQRRSELALQILTRINGPTKAEKEIRQIQETMAQETGSLAQLLQPGLRRALLLGVVLAVFQQVTGINAVLYYAPRIFERAGLQRVSAIGQSALVGLVNMLTTVVAIVLVDRLGRKPLLLTASAGMGVSLLLAGGAFHFHWFSGPWLLLLILLYVAFFALAMGPVVWVVLAEIFPNRIRGRAMSLATVALWIACFTVSLTFPVLADRFNVSLTFWIYALMCLVCFIFIKAVLPETKGKTLEDIEKNWR